MSVPAITSFVPKHALFFGFNVGVFALLLCAIWPLVDFISERDAEIATKHDTLRRLQSIISREAEIRASSDLANKQSDQSEFLSGPNESIIGADLQTRLKTIVERSGVRIRMIQTQPAKTTDLLRYVGVQLTFSGNLQNVQKAIHEIENTKPYLFIKMASLKLNAPPTRTPIMEEPVVDARLDVFGATLP